MDGAIHPAPLPSRIGPWSVSPDGTDDPSGSITSQTTRGFTGHEELGDVSLVHMNGRVYDPLLGRFGSADPTTENPFSTQGWNRYSYVGNSPLNFTDPSGYCFLGCFWQPIFEAIGALFRNIPILGAILKIAAPYFCGPFAPVCAVLASSFVAGVTSGKLGVALKAGLITAVTIGAFHIAGELTGGFPGAPYGGHGPLDAGSEAHLFNIASHALIGCASPVAGGGKCGPGALSGGVGAAAGPLLNDLDPGSKLVATAVIGGTASVAGGGSFANGAVTAGFGYLFNELQYSASVGGTLAMFLGAGGNINVGVSVPDNWQDIGGYQLFAGVQGNGMAGAGLFAGWGVSVARSVSDGPLPLFSADTGWYTEFDIGNGPASFSASAQGPWGQPPSAQSVSPVPRIGQGAGIYWGVGGNASATFALPTFRQIYNSLVPRGR